MGATGWIKRNGFSAGLLLGVLLAWLVPEAGRKGGLLRAEVTTPLAVVVIFLIQGLVLRGEELVRGLREWRVHLLCHVFIFALAPVIFGLLLLPVAGLLPFDLVVGLAYLGILPTTISSAGVLTLRAGGLVTVALFNGTLSNVLGVFLVPLAVALAGASVEGLGGLSPVDAIVRVSLLILAPFIAGQLLRRFVHRAVGRVRGALVAACSTLIVYIVFTAFSDSFAQGLWSGQNPVSVVMAAVFVVVAMGALHGAIFLLARRWPGRGHAAFPALLFCGAQKTLASGLPMAQSIFADAGVNLGLVILPILLYHPLQLIFGAWLSTRLGAATSSRCAPGG